MGALLGDAKVARAFTDNVPDIQKPPPGARSDFGLNTAGYGDIPIAQLQRGRYQPRSHINQQALAELAESIKSQGIVQPLLVRPTAAGQYEIIAGERRWRGAQLAGLATVPVVIREITDQAAMAVGLIENIQRENLNAMEQARGYQRLIREFGLTHQEVSAAVGCSRTAVSNLLRMLALHPAVQKRVESGQLDMGHARALLSLAEDVQAETAARVISKGLSVRQTERLVKAVAKAEADPESASGQSHQSRQSKADIAHLQEDLSTRLGARVVIRHGAKKGRVVIHYHSLDELDGILERIR